MNSHPNYDLLGVIGQGSTATVHRAYDTSLNRYVAIKELNEKFRRDPRRLQEFWEEAQFLAGIRHENIVQIYSLERDQGWIIMELMSNSLDNLIDRKGLAPDLVRSILQQALRALDFLHQKGKLHAGIRPASLLIDEQGHIKLSDSAGITVGGEMRRPTGSSKYLAPELINPQFGEVGPGLDLYNLGLAGIELLLGKPAFEALFPGVGPEAIDPDMGWMRWQGSERDQMPDVRTLVPGMPEDLAAVLERLTKKPVVQRYPTAADALRDLDNRPLVLVDPNQVPQKHPNQGFVGGVVPIGATPMEPDPVVYDPYVPALPGTYPEPYGGNYAGDYSIPPGPRPFSLAWFNYQFKRPLIILPLLLLLLLGIGYFVFFGGSPTDPRPKVTVRIKPADAVWRIYRASKKDYTPDPKKPGLKSGDSVHLDAGRWKIKLEHPDGIAREEELKFDKDTTFDFELRSVVYKSDPMGAEVLIAGKKVGVTGDKISGPGFPYDLEIVGKDGSIKKKILSAKDEEEIFELGKTRSLIIETIPPGAVVRVMDKAVGKSDKAFEVPRGPFKLELLGPEGHAGILPFVDAKFNPVPGTKKFTHTFQRELYLTTTPPSARIWVNGEERKETTPEVIQVPVIKFELKVKVAEGEKVLTVEPDSLKTKTDPGGKVMAALHVKILPSSLVAIATAPEDGAKIVLEEAKGVLTEKLSPFTFDLAPGSYPLAISKKGYRTVKDVLVVAKDDIKKTYPLERITRRALLVGVHDYGNGKVAPDFLHAEPDAEVLGDFFRAARFDQITVLTQSRGKKDKAELPTADTIRERLKAYAGDLAAEDTLWVGLFGRVISLEASPGKGVKDYFWPAGADPDNAATLLPLEELLTELRACKAQTKVLLLDGWRHSFRVADGPLVAARAFRPAPADVQGIFVLSSCPPAQKGYDMRVERNGIFGRAVMLALAGDADADKDDWITAAELEDELKKTVLDRARVEYGADQHVAVEAHGLDPKALPVFNVPLPLKHFGEGLKVLEKARDKEEFAKARELFTLAIDAEKDLVEAYVRRGEASLFEGRHTEAAADVREALKKNPNHGLAWSHLGDAQLKAEGLAPAEASHQEAIKLEPAFALAYRDLGRLYFQANQVKKSLKLFEKAVEMNPEMHLGWFDLGRAHHTLGSHDEAVKSLSEYLLKCPKDDKHLAIGYQWRGTALLDRGRKTSGLERKKFLELARDDYAEVVKRVAGKAGHWNRLGLVYSQLGDNENAAASFEEASRQADRFADVFYNLGVERKKLKDYTRAIEALREAVKMRYVFPDAHAELYDSYRLRAGGPSDREDANRHMKIAREQGYKFK